MSERSEPNEASGMPIELPAAFWADFADYRADCRNGSRLCL